MHGHMTGCVMRERTKGTQKMLRSLACVHSAEEGPVGLGVVPPLPGS